MGCEILIYAQGGKYLCRYSWYMGGCVDFTWVMLNDMHIFCSRVNDQRALVLNTIQYFKSSITVARGTLLNAMISVQPKKSWIHRNTLALQGVSKTMVFFNCAHFVEDPVEVLQNAPKGIFFTSVERILSRCVQYAGFLSVVHGIKYDINCTFFLYL